MRKRLISVSKFLSLEIRHQPELIGLSVHYAGWVEVDELLLRASQSGVGLNRELLEQGAKQNNKQRFSFSDDGLRIRANYGHSIPVNLGFTPHVPPEVLFHGTATSFVSQSFRIWRDPNEFPPILFTENRIDQKCEKGA